MVDERSVLGEFRLSLNPDEALTNLLQTGTILSDSGSASAKLESLSIDYRVYLLCTESIKALRRATDDMKEDHKMLSDGPKKGSMDIATFKRVEDDLGRVGKSNLELERSIHYMTSITRRNIEAVSIFLVPSRYLSLLTIALASRLCLSQQCNGDERAYKEGWTGYSNHSHHYCRLFALHLRCDAFQHAILRLYAWERTWIPTSCARDLDLRSRRHHTHSPHCRAVDRILLASNSREDIETSSGRVWVLFG